MAPKKSAASKPVVAIAKRHQRKKLEDECFLRPGTAKKIARACGIPRISEEMQTILASFGESAIDCVIGNAVMSALQRRPTRSKGLNGNPSGATLLNRDVETGLARMGYHRYISRRSLRRARRRNKKKSAEKNAEKQAGRKGRKPRNAEEKRAVAKAEDEGEPAQESAQVTSDAADEEIAE